MTAEINVNFSMQVLNGLFRDEINPIISPVDQAAIGKWGGIQIVGFAAEEDLAVTDIATLGWCFLQNLDAANFIKYGPKSGGVMIPFGRLKPGEFCWVRLEPGITIRCIADTAVVKLDIRLYED